MLAKYLAFGAALVATASAQSTTVTATSTQSQSMPATATQYFNINNVSTSDKQSWCLGETNTCRSICDYGSGMGTSMNNCDPTTLDYSCVCRNGTAPDMSAWMESIPYKECEASYSQCIIAADQNLDKERTCEDQKQCGTRNATSLDSASSSSSSSSSTMTRTTGTVGQSSTGSSSPSPTTNAAMTYSREASTGAFVALLLAACKLFL